MRQLLSTAGVIAVCLVSGLAELLALQRARLPWLRHRTRGF